MSTYIPKQIRRIRERLEAKLDRELIAKLDRYCEYLESDRDYVVAAALSMAFRKDKGFAVWQRNHPMPQPTPDGTGDDVQPRNRIQQ